jgi:phage terminase small subunit
MAPKSQNKKHSERTAPLTRMQKRYVEEVLRNPNSTDTSAALRAGYSAKCAGPTATNLNQNPVVKAAIEEGRKTVIEKFELNTDRIIQELCKIAFANLGEQVTVNEHGDIVVENGAPVELSIESDGKGKVLKKVKTVRSADKLAALVQIGKQLGMFKDQVELSGKVSLVDLVEASFKETHPDK